MAISKLIFNGVTQMDVTGTTAVVSDVTQGKKFILIDGTEGTGTGSGGGPSATQHEIYFEFSDSTNTTINAWYDDSFISDAITATTPTTYDSKTVTLAQLDGVTWYAPAPIPLNVQLIDFTAAKSNIVVNDTTGEEEPYNGSFCSDFTPIDPLMVFSFTAYRWYSMMFYDSNQTFISSVYTNNISTSFDGEYGSGTLSSANIPATAAYIRINSYPNYNISTSTMSLIRTQ